MSFNFAAKKYFAFLLAITIYILIIMCIIRIITIIIVLVYDCSCIYPVAVSVFRRAHGRGRRGAVEHDYRVIAPRPSPRFLLNLLQDNFSVNHSPLQHGDEEENQPTHGYGPASHVEAWRVRV